MSNTNGTPDKAVEATAHPKLQMRVVLFQATSISNGTPHGIKRSHQAAFGSEHCEDGGVHGVPHCYSGLDSAIKTPQKQQQQQRPPVLIPRSRRHRGRAREVLDKAPLDASLRRGSKSEQVLEKVSAWRAVSFNDQIQQVLFLQDDIIGHETGLMTTELSGVPSAAWQKMWLEQTILLRQKCLQKARDGCMPACVMSLQQMGSSKSIQGTLEGDATKPDDEMNSTMAAFANMTLSANPTASSEITVRHLLVGDLYLQAVEEIEDHVQRRLSTLTYSTDKGLRSAIESLQRRTKDKLTELLKYMGIVYPYHGLGEHSEAVEDALQDRDWTEVDAKADALFVSCASPWVVEAMKDITEKFKKKLDKKTRSKMC